MRKLIVRNRNGANETMSMLGEQFAVLAAGEETGSYEVFVQTVRLTRDRRYILTRGTRRFTC
jgi:hypothetical protein